VYSRHSASSSYYIFSVPVREEIDLVAAMCPWFELKNRAMSNLAVVGALTYNWDVIIPPIFNFTVTVLIC